MWHWKVLFIFLLAILILQCESYLIRKYLVPYDFTSSRKVSKYLPNSASLIAEFEIWNANTTSNAPSSIVPFNSGYNVKKFLKSCFLPAGKLSQDYFVYSRWRALQRYISATNNVFGTQALMLALGITKRKVGTTLATTWVLKDVLGKVSRIFWASQFGKKFDENAKRWRFRSSVLYAIGNCLELLTYMFPSLFLVSAALANALKQVSMLTSSATRNTM